MEFVNKEYFILLTLLIPYIIWYWRNRKHSEPTMRVSTVAAYYKAPKSWRQRIVHAPMVLRCLAFVMIVCVMARPQTRNSWDNKSVEGIDIMLAMDVSTSMLAEDLKPNRLEAAKNVAAEFVAGRPNDNIGLTIFAGESFTQSARISSYRHSCTRHHLRRYSHWYGTCKRRFATEGIEGKEQGRNPSYRR